MKADAANREEENLRRVYQLFSPEPLDISQRDLYVELDGVRGDVHPMQRIAKNILLADKPTCQVLAGHRGSGKSTELRWLKKTLEEKCYFTVLCDTREDVDPNDVDLLEVLIAIMRQLAKQLEAVKIKLAPGYFRDRWDRVKGLLGSEVSFENIGVEAGMLKISTAIKNSPDARLKLREAMEPDMGNWLHAANDLIGKAVLELGKKGWRGLVVLVDDLDKMVLRPHSSAGCSTGEYLFVNRHAQSSALACHTLYTVPIALAYSRLEPTLANLYGGTVPVLPMVKIQLPPPKRGDWAMGIDKFREIIQKRLSEAAVQARQVFADDQVRDQLIRMTGGQPREIMYLLREALITETPITAKAVDRAVRERRKAYERQLFAEDWPIIEEVRRTGSVKRAKDNDAIVRDLLDSRVILQYVNDREWYDVNPVIVEPPKPSRSKPKPESSRKKSKRAAYLKRTSPRVEGRTPLPEVVAEGKQTEAELQALRRVLVASRGAFSFSLAVCNSPALRDRLIEQLSAGCPGICTVALPAGTLDPFNHVRQEMQGQTAAALCMVDLEKSLPSDAGDWPALRSLNASRELWARGFAVPVILWLPAYAATLLGKYARDLWAWFSHQFEFVTEEGAGTGSPTIASSPAGMDSENLDADRKWLRIAELQHRVQEAEQGKDHVLTQHVSGWLKELGRLHHHLGSLDQAEHAFSRAMEIDLKIQDDVGLAAACGNLGIVYKTRGDLEKAEKLYRQSLEIFQKLGQLEGMAAAYSNLGTVYGTRRDLEQAEKMHSQALEIHQKLGHIENLAIDYGNLGNVFMMRADLGQAERMHREALTIDQKLGRPKGIARHQSNLGIVYASRGDLEQAEKMFRQTLDINQKLGSLEGMAIAYANLGSLYEAQADKARAREMWSKALELFGRIGADPEAKQIEQFLKNLPKDDTTP